MAEGEKKEEICGRKGGEKGEERSLQVKLKFVFTFTSLDKHNWTRIRTEPGLEVDFELEVIHYAAVVSITVTVNQ